MTAEDSFRSAVDNLTAHKLRSTLSMLGMIFGVGAVIAMLSIGGGAERQVMEMIDRMGVRNILVRSKEPREEEAQELRKKSLGVSRRDAQAILEGVPGAELAAPRLEVKAYKVMAAGAKSDAKVFGVSWQQAQLGELPLAEGRFLDARDEAEHAQVCVIGAGVRRDLFGFGPAIGADLKVNDVWLEVVGVLQDFSGASSVQGVSIGSTSTEIYLPFTTALRKFDRQPIKSPLDEIVIRLAPSASPEESAGVVRTLLDRLHAGVADYEIVVPEALLAQSRRTQRLFNVVMGCIAGISLLVGGIGIMNIMLASVLERTREIGVRRAVGATRREIRKQFIVESFSISLAGGLAGVVMGLVIAKAVAAYAGWPTVVSLTSVRLLTGVSMAVGLASGIYPATRAAALDPIDALRYE